MQNNNLKTSKQADKDITAETIRRFERFENNSQRRAWVNSIIEDVEALNNAQWSPEDVATLKANNIPAVVYNEMKPARDQSVQQMTSNNPKFIATARENSDVQLASDVSELTDYIWDVSGGRLKFIKNVENFSDYGMAVLSPYYDPNADWGNGEIKIRVISPLQIYIDPRSTERNAEDASDIFHCAILSEAQLLSMYPDADITQMKAWNYLNVSRGTAYAGDGQIFLSELDPSERHYRCIDRCTKVKRPMFKVYDPASRFEQLFDEEEYKEFALKTALIVTKAGAQKPVTKDFEIRKWLNYIKEYQTLTFHFMTDGTVMPGTESHGAVISQQGQVLYPIPGSTIQIEITNNAKLLSEGLIKWDKVLVDRIRRILVLGETLYSDRILPISRYPYAIMMLNHTNTPYPYGDARLAIKVQQQINKARSLITAYNINIASLKVFIPVGTDVKQLEEKWGKAGAQFFTYDPTLGGIPIVLQYQQMANALYEQIDRDKHLIQRIYGVYEFQDGAVQSFPQTVGATQLIDEYGQRRSAYKMLFIEEQLNNLGMIISEMIPKVYTTRKFVRITQGSGKAKDIIFNEEIQDNGETTIMNDLTANKYDIKIMSGSTLPTNRGAELQQALQLWDRQILRDDETVLRLTNLQGLDEIINKNSILKEAEAQLQGLTKTIKQLQGTEQRLESELMHADRKVEREKFKGSLKGITSEIKSQVVLGKARLNDQIKQQKKSSKGAKTSQGDEGETQ